MRNLVPDMTTRRLLNIFAHLVRQYRYTGNYMGKNELIHQFYETQYDLDRLKRDYIEFPVA